MAVVVMGRSNLVVLRVERGLPSHGRVVAGQAIRRRPRVQVKLPFAYRMVVGDVVVPELRRGTILYIGYHGVLAEIAHAPSLFSELVLAFDLPLAGEKVSELYGKVVKVLEREGGARIGVEFSAMTAGQRAAVQLFVQLIIQGAETG